MLHSSLKPCLAAALGGLVLAGCASTDEDREPRERNPYIGDARLGEEIDRICFGSQIDGFGETTDYTVIVEARVNDYYLIETSNYCQDLDFAQSIAFDRATSCLTRGDAILAFDTVFPHADRPGIGPNRCLIRHIYEWDPDAEAEEEEEEDGEASN